MKNRFLLKIILFFYFALIIGCSEVNSPLGNASKENLKTITVKTLGSDSLVHLSNFIKDVQLVPLELTDECILGDVWKIVISDKHLYIKDRQNTSGVFKFDMQGKFIEKIGVQGKGPGEHVVLTDFSINEESKSIYIYDNAQQKINEYGVDGKYLNEIFIGHSAENFEYKNDLFYLYRMNPSALSVNHDLVIKNMEGETIANYFNSDPQGSSSHKRVFTIKENSLMVKPPFNDTIYSLINDSLSYSYYIDFGEHKIKEEDLKQILKDTRNTFKILQKNNYAGPVSCIFQAGSLLYFSSSLNAIQNYSFHNLETGQTVNSYNIIDDVSYLFFCDPISQTKDALISVYSPSLLDHNINTIKNLTKEKIFSTEKGEKVISNIMSLKQKGIEKMNPVVLFYYVK